MQINLVNKQNNNTGRNQVTFAMKFFDFVVLWYYFFSPSLVLRPFASFVWVAIAIIGLFVFRCRKIRLNRYVSLSVLAVFALFVASLFSVDIGASMKYTLSIFLYMIIAYELCVYDENIRCFLKIAIPFIAIHAIATVLQIFNFGLYSSIFLPLLPSEFQSTVIGFASRFAYTGFTNQTSTNADILSLGVGVLFSMLFIYKRVKKGVLFASLIGLVLLIPMTERRWPTVVVFVLLSFAIMTQVKSKMLKGVIVFVIIILLFTGIYTSLSVFQGVIGKMQYEISAGDVTNGRLEIWKVTWDFIIKKPLFGYGPDTFKQLITIEVNAHNSFLQTILERVL